MFQRFPNLKVVTVEAGSPIGSPEKPLGADLMRAKFRDCAGNAIRPIAARDIDATLDALIEFFRD